MRNNMNYKISKKIYEDAIKFVKNELTSSYSFIDKKSIKVFFDSNEYNRYERSSIILVFNGKNKKDEFLYRVTSSASFEIAEKEIVNALMLNILNIIKNKDEINACEKEYLSLLRYNMLKEELVVNKQQTIKRPKI